MKENFDATQFVTFDIGGNLVEIMDEIKRKFERLGFEVLDKMSMRKVKKEYFESFQREVFLELKNELFIGEIEFLQDESGAKQIVLDFVQNMQWLCFQKDISNLALIITAFAEKDYTSNTAIKVTSENILGGICTMSKYNYEVWTDNLIIEITS